MRTDPIQFAQANTARGRQPRWVIKIEFPFGSIYCTSHTGITGVPGTVLEGVVKSPSAISQKLFPDEGRSEIGSFSFTALDKSSGMTAALRDQLLNNGKGIRNRRVLFYIGYAGFDFTAFQLFGTYIVDGCDYDRGLYQITASDVTREQRAQIFKPYTTTLTASITATDATVPVNDTSRFIAVAHGSSYSDAPGSTVYYFRIEDELIRATGKTGTSFTGCTRGVFNTRAVPHTIDAATPVSRRTTVTEFIYLEMPGPKLAYAVMTGIIYGTAFTLPTHWHLGMDPALVRLSDFENIGPDLWVPADDSAAAPLIFRFDGLKAQDGKRFLEREIYLLLACYSQVYSDGTLGLRRMSPVISSAPPLITLTEKELISLSALTHDLSGMHNLFSVDWAYDEIADRFLRDTAFVDQESIDAHGAAPLVTYQFRGLHSQRATDSTIIKKLDSIRDRFAEPPQRIEASVHGSLNRLELGDIVAIDVSPNVLRDFAREIGNYRRSHEIQQKIYDAYTGAVRLSLFGSTSRPTALPITGDATPPLADAFYISAGAALTTIIPVAGGIAAVGSYHLPGDPSLNASGAIYYFAGDLQIPNGCNITIDENVQLRVRGFLTLNGTINGVGGGHPGTSDPGTGAWDTVYAGTPGLVGNSRGGDGARNHGSSVRVAGAATLPAAFTRARYDAFPSIELTVGTSAVLGLPDDLQGSGGAPGGRVVSGMSGDVVLAAGGAGGAGGAGLLIICRGMSIGGSGNITLDGEDSAATASVAFAPFGALVYPGCGGAGGPGALLLLLDGDTISVPEITLANFSAKSGSVPQLGNPMPTPDNPTGLAGGPVFFELPMTGYADPAVISGKDFSAAARGLQFIPASSIPGADPDPLPPAPTNLVVTPGPGNNTLRVTGVLLDPRDSFEIYGAVSNDRTGAVLVAKGRVTEFTHELPVLATRYYWVLVRREETTRPDVLSPFFPASAIAGVAATSLNPGSWTPITTNGGGATMLVTANQITKSGGVLGWDSQVYSLESFIGGCALSFRALSTAADFMIGLNTDPTLDASYTSLDFAWYCLPTGVLQIFENGIFKGNFTTYDTSTSLSITYDGVYVRYFRNGVEVRKVARISERFYLDSSWYTPGGGAAAVQFIPAPGATNVVALQARGTCVTQGNAIQKRGGSNAWDSDCYSLEAFSAGCAMRFRPGQTNCALMIGLNSDPTTDQNYTSLDYCFHINNSGDSSIYESGTLIVSFGAYTTNTVFSLTYDGLTVRYFIDGNLKREVAAPGKVLFLDSSFFHIDGAVLDVFFGALNSSPSQRLLARGNCQVIGNSIQKVGGAAAFDSDCYSNEKFEGGCALSWRVQTDTTGDYFMGLNSDPTTDQNYTSLDYAFEIAFSGGLKYWIYESSVQKAAAIALSDGDVLSIKYDGQWIRYYVNGVVVRQVADPGRTFFFDSSFYMPGHSTALDVNFGPLTRATPSQFLARNNCQISDTNIIKQGGSSAWDSDCYSIVGYPVCHVAFKSNQTNKALMVALNTDPATDSDYTSLDYAWYLDAGGALHIYESGSEIGSSIGGSYTTSTVFAITYDGSTVTYLKDGVSIRTVSVSSLTLFMDSSFHTPGGGINSLRFGPTTNLAVIDTPQIGDNAATEIVFETHDFAGAAFGTFTARTITFTPAADCDIELTSTVVADNTLADSGNILRWTVTPSGGGETTVGQDGSTSTAKQQFFCNAVFSAVGGVAIDLKIKTIVSGASIHLFTSQTRITMVKK